MILCELCKQQPSTLHLTEIAGGAKKELHLCAKCAQQKGVTFQSHFSLPDFLSGFGASPPAAKAAKKSPGVACPRCGITYAQFRQTGRLGCAEDYVVFRKMLLPFIERIHGSVQHTGKVPGRAGAPRRAPEAAQEIAELRRALAEAIEREAYEEAARLRDEIRRREEAAAPPGPRAREE